MPSPVPFILKPSRFLLASLSKCYPAEWGPAALPSWLSLAMIHCGDLAWQARSEEATTEVQYDVRVCALSLFGDMIYHRGTKATALVPWFHCTPTLLGAGARP